MNSISRVYKTNKMNNLIKCNFYKLFNAEFHMFFNMKTVTTIGFTFWINNLLKKAKNINLKEEDWYGYFKASINSIPSYKKRAKGGEDASFQSQNLLVVADGVGGWNELGIDPAEYSKTLCELVSYNFKKYAREINEKSNKKINEVFIKQMIVKSVKQNNKMGSSTLCLLYLDKNKNELFSGFIGDSCYMITRPRGVGKFDLIYKSEEQTHGFNIPFQVGTEGDDPNKAVINKHKIEKNDLIVVATDGLWDNIEVENILEEINKFSLQHNTINLNTDDISKYLSQKAEELSMDPNHYSPFAKRAIENKYKNYYGGKPDDITIIVAQILYNNTENILEKSNSNKSTDSLNSADTTLDNENDSDSSENNYKKNGEKKL